MWKTASKIPPTTMTEHERDPSSFFDRVMQHLREREERLQDGGPEVDWEKLVNYEDNCLDPQTRREVEYCLRTWRAWYRARIEVIAGLAKLDGETQEEE